MPPAATSTNYPNFLKFNGLLFLTPNSAGVPKRSIFRRKFDVFTNHNTPNHTTSLTPKLITDNLVWGEGGLDGVKVTLQEIRVQ